MPHIGRLAAVVIVAVIIIAAAYVLLHINISALPEPGKFETTVATKAKDWYIGLRAIRYPRRLRAAPRWSVPGKHCLAWVVRTAMDRTDASLPPSANRCIRGCST